MALSEQKASASEDLDKKKAEINELKLTLEKSKIEAQAAIDKATATLTNEVKELRNQLSLAAKDKQLELTNQKNAFETTLKMKEEEIDRLKAHLVTAQNLLNSGEAVGRRLDFLCQELNREANTTCSKSSEIDLTNLGMALKTLIEQFREQVQNIE